MFVTCEGFVVHIVQKEHLFPSLIGVTMSHSLVLLRHPGIEYGLISREAFLYHILSFCDKSPFEIKPFPSYFS